MDCSEEGNLKLYDKNQRHIELKELENEFEPAEYMKCFDASNSTDSLPYHHTYKLRLLHQSFSVMPSELSILDYGAGPVVVSVISAATKASSIVLADYVEKNLDELRRWLGCDENGHDWSAYFSYVVNELEGGKDERYVREREELLRSKVRAVVSCDITKDPPIDESHVGPYDVVICSLVLEGASSTHDEYRSNFARLAKLVKPGGFLFCYGVENPTGYYTVGKKNFPNVYVTNQLAVKVFEDNGFRDITLEAKEIGDRVFRFIRGTR